MTASASLYLWRYKKAKEDLEKKCGEEIFVPTLVPVQRTGDLRVGRAFTYTRGLPMIVPESEWVFIVGAKKGFFREKKSRKLLSLAQRLFVNCS